jgi:hypothetical protein
VQDDRTVVVFRADVDVQLGRHQSGLVGMVSNRKFRGQLLRDDNDEND